MSDIETKARQLLAESYRKSEYPPMVHESYNLIHGYPERRERAAISALVVALTPADVCVNETLDVDDVRELFEQWANGRDLTPDTWGVSSYVSPYVDNDWEVWRDAWRAISARQEVK